MIEEKRDELLKILESKFQDLVKIVENPELSNPEFKDFVNAKIALCQAADKIVDFNGMVREFFT